MTETENEPDKKWERLKELASRCRILSFLSLVAFALISFILIGVCNTTLGSGDPHKFDLSSPISDSKPGEGDAIYLIFLTIMAILSSLTSLLLLFATFNKSMWLTIPFWVLLVILMLQNLYQLLYYGLCLGKCKSSSKQDEGLSQFVVNTLNGGGVYIYTSITEIAFLLYAFIPSFGFFLQCRAKRAALLAAIAAVEAGRIPVSRLPPPPHHLHEPHPSSPRGSQDHRSSLVSPPGSANASLENVQHPHPQPLKV